MDKKVFKEQLWKLEDNLVWQMIVKKIQEERDVKIKVIIYKVDASDNEIKYTALDINRLEVQYIDYLLNMPSKLDLKNSPVINGDTPL